MVTQFNNMMLRGKKSTALQIFYDAMDLVKDRTKAEEHGVWKKALNNVMPLVEVRRAPDRGRHVPDPDRDPRQSAKWLRA